MPDDLLEEQLRILVSIVILAAPLSFTRPYFRRMLASEAFRLRTTNDSAARPATAATGAEHFSPWEDLEQLDIVELRKAKQRVDVAMYSFTDRRLAEVVNELAAQQVEIRVYRDQEQFQDEERAGVRFREPSTTQLFRGRPMIRVRVKQGALRDLMHEKAFCIDGHLLREGSANWSRGGLLMQDNNVHYFSDVTDIERFEKTFEAMWARRDNLVVR
jgi:phosphatidylserine/phosphatidylglycerophosphate/cardiolipin synthase-like enzyme